MSRAEQLPVTESTPDDPCHDSITRHPAFAEISASRGSWSGAGVQLYGSDFGHGHAVTITIARSELHRGLSRDSYMTRGELIAVTLSEAQWASFVSNFNAGGTPCTLQHIERKQVPRIAPPLADVADKYVEEMHDTVREVGERLAKLAADPRLPQWARKEASGAHMQLTNSTGFIASQFAEHVEETTEAARIEVNAIVTQAVHRAGLTALAGPDAAALLKLPEVKK